MKDKDQILEGHVNITKAGRVVPVANVKFVMDEYAEAYAKAYLSYLVDKGYARHGDSDGFKESLKK